MASFASGEPYIENGWHMGGFPGDGQGTARKEDHHHRFTGGQKGLQQIALAFGKRDVRTARCFTAHLGRFPHGSHHHVGFHGCGHGLPDHQGGIPFVVVSGLAKNTDPGV